MSQPERFGITDPGRGTGWDGGGDAAGPTDSERVAAAALARTTGWSAEATIALGDGHDKGEDSLCVGEAA
jgi:hypothetical protein